MTSAQPGPMPRQSRRSVISVLDVSAAEVDAICERAQTFSSSLDAARGLLSGRIVGTYFKHTSTRTRTAFTVATLRLGGEVVAYGPSDLQLNTGETLADTGRVLSSMLDLVIARTADPDDSFRELQADGRLAVVNAMSESEHPTQALADLAFMRSTRDDLEGVRVLYVGEGNNSAASLALALSRVPHASATFLTPRGYGLTEEVLAAAEHQATLSDAVVRESHSMSDRPPSVDFIYTTRWQTTGTSKDDPNWRSTFGPFTVDRSLVGNYPGALVMHDLPARRDEEISAEVMGSPGFVGFRQAEFKLYSAMSLLELLLA